MLDTTRLALPTKFACKHFVVPEESAKASLSAQLVPGSVICSDAYTVWSFLKRQPKYACFAGESQSSSSSGRNAAKFGSGKWVEKQRMDAGHAQFWNILGRTQNAEGSFIRFYDDMGTWVWCNEECSGIKLRQYQAKQVMELDLRNEEDVIKAIELVQWLAKKRVEIQNSLLRLC
ncbi:hypothetical protein QOT17_015887 [Balamuthia mandrillaris]